MTTSATQKQKDAANEYFFIEIHQNASFSCEHYQQDEWVFTAETDLVISTVVIGPKGGIKQQWAEYK